MDVKSWVATVRQFQVIAVIRAANAELGLQMAQAVVAGGVRLVEITWNSDRPADLIRRLRHTLPTSLVGAGTLTTSEEVAAAIAAGAQFLFTPHVSSSLIQHAVAQQIPLVAGALTSTEIVTAWQLGAASVKVFPVQAVGGASYIRSLQAPLGNIPLIPTGGVTLANAPDFLQAGAIAVGLSSDLFPPKAVQEQNWTAVTDRVAALMEQLGRLKQEQVK